MTKQEYLAYIRQNPQKGLADDGLPRKFYAISDELEKMPQEFEKDPEVIVEILKIHKGTYYDLPSKYQTGEVLIAFFGNDLKFQNGVANIPDRAWGCLTDDGKLYTTLQADFARKFYKGNDSFDSLPIRFFSNKEQVSQLIDLIRTKEMETVKALYAKGKLDQSYLNNLELYLQFIQLNAEKGFASFQYIGEKFMEVVYSLHKIGNLIKNLGSQDIDLSLYNKYLKIKMSPEEFLQRQDTFYIEKTLTTENPEQELKAMLAEDVYRVYAYLYDKEEQERVKHLSTTIGEFRNGDVDQSTLYIQEMVEKVVEKANGIIEKFKTNDRVKDEAMKRLEEFDVKF